MTPNFDSCPNCGGRLVGDGFTLVIHCETIDPPSDAEPDAKPVYCGSKTRQEIVPHDH